jgi:hypothetical protein
MRTINQINQSTKNEEGITIVPQSRNEKQQRVSTKNILLAEKP